MSHLKKFMGTVLIGIAALIAEFVFDRPLIAFWIVAVMGGVMTLTLLVDMIQTLRSGKYGIDILAVTAILATLVVGEYWASLMILVMLTGGDSLEEYASRQAGSELRSLLEHSPQIAHRITAEKITDVEVAQVKVAEELLIKPGELVPVDGRVLEGTTLVDESSLTGEAQLIEKKPGAALMSGSVVTDSSIRMKVEKKASDSQYQQLVKLVKESKEHPARFVRLADQYAVPFTLAAYLIGGVAWFLSDDASRFAEVLVVASPCPLILAAPVALVAGMSRTSRMGIVVKNGTTIEKLAKAPTIVFDKTGTLTKGQLSVDNIEVQSHLVTAEEVLQLAASAEQESAHILAAALVKRARQSKLVLLPVEKLQETTGQGVCAIIDQRRIKVGRPAFVGIQDLHASQQTCVYLSIEGKYAGKITFKDQIRPETASTITQLQQLGLEKTVMLTGDNGEVARQVAEKVAIKEVHAQCLPEEKNEVIRRLKKEGGPVIMVGDGVNDAPALALADVGIAMGVSGSTAASESADAVILKDDLSRVVAAIRLSRETMKIARQSVLIGIIICLVLMLVATTGVLPALIGAALQEVVDTVSILSALRARKNRKPTKKDGILSLSHR